MIVKHVLLTRKSQNVLFCVVIIFFVGHGRVMSCRQIYKHGIVMENWGVYSENEGGVKGGKRGGRQSGNGIKRRNGIVWCERWRTRDDSESGRRRLIDRRPATTCLCGCYAPTQILSKYKYKSKKI